MIVTWSGLNTQDVDVFSYKTCYATLPPEAPTCPSDSGVFNDFTMVCFNCWHYLNCQFVLYVDCFVGGEWQRGLLMCTLLRFLCVPSCAQLDPLVWRELFWVERNFLLILKKNKKIEILLSCLYRSTTCCSGWFSWFLCSMWRELSSRVAFLWWELHSSQLSEVVSLMVRVTRRSIPLFCR